MFRVLSIIALALVGLFFVLAAFDPAPAMHQAPRVTESLNDCQANYRRQFVPQTEEEDAAIILRCVRERHYATKR